MTRPTPPDVLERCARSCAVSLGVQFSGSFSVARMETPDDVYQMLTAARWEPREGGWLDPDAGEVVRWQEAVRRARRRVR